MVAEATKSPPEPQKRLRKLVPWRIPETTRLSVKSLYVVHGRLPKDIAPLFQLNVQQVHNLIQREGWRQLRPKMRSAQQVRDERIEQAFKAREESDIARVVESTAILSEDLSLRSLNFCSELLDAKDPKGLQMASGAARNFVQIARMSRGLDSRHGSNSPQDSQLNVNLFLVRGETLEQSLKPAIEVVAKAIPS